ncbi:MAG: sensor domain-containing protein [Steroidobacteraceae bacterium]
MKVAFPYIAQTHQIPHSLPVAAELSMQRPDWKVHVVCSSDDQERVVRRLIALYPQARLQLDRFKIGPLTRLHQRLVRASIPAKTLTLIGNRRYFRSCDAVVVPERTSLILRRLRLPALRMIWTNHGAPGRAVTYARDLIQFDFLLLAGERQAARMREQGTLRAGHYHTGTYAKFDLINRIDARRQRLFSNDRPTVLYNPHFEPALSSWPRDGFKVLDHFAASSDWNLIFAPHVRLFDRHDPATLARLEKYRSVSHMRIDTGSDASIDMTYTHGADVYLGDVSSQICEFMVRPRPCVFIDSHRTAWQNNPDYLFWELGQVINGVDTLEAALKDAVANHGQWAARQREFFRATFDAEPETLGHSAAAGANAIAMFLEGGR